MSSSSQISGPEWPAGYRDRHHSGRSDSFALAHFVSVLKVCRAKLEILLGLFEKASGLSVAELIV